MNRPLPTLLAALVLALATDTAFGAERPKPKRPERLPFEVAKPIEKENFWVGVFGPTNCSWIDTGDGVFVIDTGATAADANNLKAEIARTTKNHPIRWIAMTHAHTDSNDGFTTFLPTDADDPRERPRRGCRRSPDGGGKNQGAECHRGQRPHSSLVAGGRAFEIGVPAGNAHTAFDLYVFDVRDADRLHGRSRDHGPLSDALGPRQRHQGLALGSRPARHAGAEALVPTRAVARTGAAAEIEKTRRYLTSMLAFLLEKKKQNAPEARVSGELSAEKLGRLLPARAERAQRAFGLPPASRPTGRPGRGPPSRRPAAK